MSARELLQKAESLGVRLWIEDGKPQAEGDDSALDALLPELKAHKSELLELLSTESRIRAWLAAIGETNEAVIAEVLNLCRNDPDTRDYYLRRANEGEIPAEPGRVVVDGAVSLPSGRVAFKLSVPTDKVEGIGVVRCADCRHKIKTDHPVLVDCAAGVQAPGACGMFWSTDSHLCDWFDGAAP